MPIHRRHFQALLASLAAGVALPALARPAPPPLMLAGDAPDGLDPRGWLVSEKLDGVRAVWDGRALQFRSGAGIAAPAWFTQALPARPVDGELWIGRGRFEELSGTVRRRKADDPAWRSVRYALFDLPQSAAPFEQRAGELRELVQAIGVPFVQALPQQPLDSTDALQRRLAAVVAAGGEGLMLHRAAALWRPGRSSELLKLKPLSDAEAVVIGPVPGRGRLTGHMGALQVRSPDGRTFRLGTGFSDAERAAPPPPGSVVTYTYRGLTDSGLPRFASFLRVRTLP